MNGICRFVWWLREVANAANEGCVRIAKKMILRT